MASLRAGQSSTSSSTTSSTSTPVKQLIEALESLKQDDGFQIPTPSAREALDFANEMLDKMKAPAKFRVATTVCRKLHYSLSQCVHQTRIKKKPTVQWGKFHALRTSTEFKSTWKNLMTSVTGKTASPIFFQYITDAWFRTVIKNTFPVQSTLRRHVKTKSDSQSSSQGAESSTLTYEECNALRYAAGYVLKSVRKRIERMNASEPTKKALKRELMESISTCIQRSLPKDQNDDNTSSVEDDEGDDDSDTDNVDDDEEDADRKDDDEEDEDSEVNEEGDNDAGNNDDWGDDDGDVDDMDVDVTNKDAEVDDDDDTVDEDMVEAGDRSCDWINSISRGGLIHITSATYHFFLSVEMIVRKKFSTTVPVRSIQAAKKQLLDDITKDADVLFYYSILSAPWSNAVEQILLTRFVELWITIRGHSFAASWMERYKQSAKKSVQKSKGIRKNLLGASACTQSSFEPPYEE